MEQKTIRMEVPYFQVPNEIFEIGLSNNEILIYIYLARCSNNSTAFPSYKTIGEKTGVSRDTAMRVMKKLENKRLIYKEHRKFIKETDDKQKVFNKSNLYYLEHDLSKFKRLGGSTQPLPLVAQNDHPSSTVPPYKELPINNYLDKELGNTDFYKKSQYAFYDNCKQFLNSIKITDENSISDYTEEIKFAYKTLEYFYHQFYNKLGYRITKLKAEQEKLVSEILSNNLDSFADETFGYYWVDLYLKEKRSKTHKDKDKQYHSFIQFIKGLNFEVMSNKANINGLQLDDFKLVRQIS